LTGITGASGALTELSADGLGGTYAYTYTGDCLASSSLASLGLNNNYYQYYYTALTAGTWAFTAAVTNSITYLKDDPGASPAVTAVQGQTSTIAVAYSGCWHSHIYNWIAMPSMSATAAVTSASNGFGSAVCAYGYSMRGTATTDCVVSSIVTTDLFPSGGSTFVGGAYQSSALTLTPTTTPTGGTAQIIPVWGQHGPGYFATLAGTAIAAAATTVGLSIVS